jgi:hypothetical protein
MIFHVVIAGLDPAIHAGARVPLMAGVRCRSAWTTGLNIKPGGDAQ